jgi:hypothetical protein
VQCNALEEVSVVAASNCRYDCNDRTLKLPPSLLKGFLAGDIPVVGGLV